MLEPRADSLTFMPYPGFESGTSGAEAGSPNQYTAWSAKEMLGIRWYKLNTECFKAISW